MNSRKSFHREVKMMIAEGFTCQRYGFNVGADKFSLLTIENGKTSIMRLSEWTLISQSQKSHSDRLLGESRISPLSTFTMERPGRLRRQKKSCRLFAFLGPYRAGLRRAGKRGREASPARRKEPGEAFRRLPCNPLLRKRKKVE